MSDEGYMWRAIDLARRVEPQAVSPNPLVGAVLVSGDRIIGEGYHRRVGEGHAEVNCLASVRPEDRPLVAASTLYVTLEPCSHQGRTPSCARLLVREGIRRVVIGSPDPNPLVSGRGIALLREAGVEVVTGCLEGSCRHLARIFLTNQEQGRPYIILKWAETGNGFLDRKRRSPEESPLQLSTPHTRMLVHRLRSRCSAILIGRRTMELDRPSLTNRYWPLSSYSPKRLVLSTGEAALPDDGWGLLREVTPESLSRLLREGMTSLLVEGGAMTLAAFLEAGLWDEIRREVAPEIILAEGITAPSLAGLTPHTTDRRDGHLLYSYFR